MVLSRFNEEARPWCQKKRGYRGDGRSSSGTASDYNRSGERTSAFYSKTPQVSAGKQLNFDRIE